jgi:cytidylate kinase
MIIALDGPAASGKGTLARRLAQHFDLPHLDTGLLYRATAQSLIERGIDWSDVPAAIAAARALDTGRFDEALLRGRAAAAGASAVAAIPGVRAALLDLQRDFARQPGGAVLDGRDIGTVICPEADVKIFVTATPETRAHRRLLEHQRRGENVDYGNILEDIRSRDAFDASRAVAPLRAAADAYLLDTSLLDAEAAFRQALSVVQSRAHARLE